MKGIFDDDVDFTAVIPTLYIYTYTLNIQGLPFCKNITNFAAQYTICTCVIFLCSTLIKGKVASSEIRQDTVCPGRSDPPEKILNVFATEN